MSKMCAYCAQRAAVAARGSSDLPLVIPREEVGPLAPVPIAPRVPVGAAPHLVDRARSRVEAVREDPRKDAGLHALPRARVVGEAEERRRARQRGQVAANVDLRHVDLHAEARDPVELLRDAVHVAPKESRAGQALLVVDVGDVELLAGCARATAGARAQAMWVETRRHEIAGAE